MEENKKEFEHNMILSASGWRKVFALSGDEQDASPEISDKDFNIAIAAADAFFEYISNKTNGQTPVIAVGMDARPTGPKIADAIIRLLNSRNAVIQFIGITAAPEIMAYARKLDGFIYISASHNPIGHNGIKFGTNDGGVLNATENAIVCKDFLKKLNNEDYLSGIKYLVDNCKNSRILQIETETKSPKLNALKAYYNFVNTTITDFTEENENQQNYIFSLIQKSVQEKPLGIVCDFNGSARTISIDKGYFTSKSINFYSINDKPGQIVHEIIPEAENLIYVAQEMERLQKEGHKEVILGYMPDCDGDRGNIVFWNEKLQQAQILKAQEVFSLSVLAELTYSLWKNKNLQNFSKNQKNQKLIAQDEKLAVCVNCPTSMRIEEIAETLGVKVFRAEVGEANVVNCAREAREKGFTVRILGEGSNGGTITYPSAVRDPLNTIFAIIKLLTIREDGLFELWCQKRGVKYNPDFSLTDVLNTIPVYTTTGVSEKRAVLHIKTKDHALLKANFQKVLEDEWLKVSAIFETKYNFYSYEAIITNGTKETRNVKDFSLSGKGGLKILFKDKKENNLAFIWMRGSGTEPVFRIMCDVKGDNPEMERKLLEWETQMLLKADNMSI